MKILNPANDEVLCEINESSSAEIQKMAKDACISQRAWRETPLEERINIVRHFSELLEKNQEDLAKITASEVGKSVEQAKGEIAGARYRIQYFLDHAQEILQRKKLNTDGNTEETIDYEPLGVIANISAWNYPYLVGVNVFIPALIAGNAVLYKPSEFATLTGIEFGKLFLAAGLPNNLFQVVIGGKSAGETLLELPLAGYFFTGSYATGKHIATQVASKLVPIGLELGGKDPLYVTENVFSIEKAAADAAEGAFYNNGQSCCAVERIYVHESIYPEFEKAFVAQVKKLSPAILTRKPQLQVLAEQVKDATDQGAKLLVGGSIVDQPGNYFEPTVLSDVNHDMKVMREESFGPIIGLQKVSSDEQAIRLMNDTEYGLTAAVFCQDKERSNEIMHQLHAGNVYQNCCDRVSPYLPWAGRGHSGLGATLSTMGLLTFVHTKGYHHRTLA